MPPSPELVVVHPLVLLSVVDHYSRVAKDTRKRVVGVLLGEVSKGRTDVTNSFAGGRLMQSYKLWCIGGLLRAAGYSAALHRRARMQACKVCSGESNMI